MPLFGKKRRAETRKELIDALNEGLRDPDPVQRLLTLERACRLRRPPSEALPAMLLALEDDSVFVRQLAAFTLGRIQEPAAVPMLIELLTHDDELLRFVSASALKKIDTPEALRAVRDADLERWERTADEVSEGAANADSESPTGSA